MKHRAATLLCVMLSGTLMLTACTPKTSVERHARQYVYAADDGFDPNFRTKKADSARLMAPFLQQFRDAGVKDRAGGLSHEDAMKRAAEFRSEEFLKSIGSRERFAGRVYEDSSIPSQKELKALGDAVAGTYLDGYEGRP